MAINTLLILGRSHRERALEAGLKSARKLIRRHMALGIHVPPSVFQLISDLSQEILYERDLMDPPPNCNNNSCGDCRSCLWNSLEE